MTKNILLSLAGVLLGFFLGFFVANFGGRPRPATGTALQSGGASTQDGQLPPGHPDVNGNTTAGGAASSSAQAQTAMDEADRSPQDFTAQIRAAAIFFQLGSYDKAELYLVRSLKLRPDDPDALTGMGQTKFQTGKYQEAATYFEKVLRQHPEDADLRTDLGNTYAKRTPPDYQRAIAEYRKALEVDPKNEQALEKLADSSLRTGDKTTAREAIDKLSSVNPSNPALSSLRATLEGK